MSNPQERADQDPRRLPDDGLGQGPATTDTPAEPQELVPSQDAVEAERRRATEAEQ